MNPEDIIIAPIITESVLEQIERDNKLVFLVQRSSNRKVIKWAIEKMYNVKVQKVNTMITVNGKKKAFVRLAPSSNAGEIATQLGIF